MSYTYTAGIGNGLIINGQNINIFGTKIDSTYIPGAISPPSIYQPSNSYDGSKLTNPCNAMVALVLLNNIEPGRTVKFKWYKQSQGNQIAETAYTIPNNSWGGLWGWYYVYDIIYYPAGISDNGQYYIQMYLDDFLLNGTVFTVSGIPGPAPTPTPTLTSITITPSVAGANTGDILNFTATEHYSNGATTVVSDGLTWSSSDTTIATISASGQCKCNKEGTVNISATYQGLSSPPVLLTIVSPVSTPAPPVSTDYTPFIIIGAIAAVGVTFAVMSNKRK